MKIKLLLIISYLLINVLSNIKAQDVRAKLFKFDILPDYKAKSKSIDQLGLKDPFKKIKKRKVERRVVRRPPPDPIILQRNKIKEKLENEYPFKGIAKNKNKIMILMGSIIMEQGKTIPNIIEEQTEIPFVYNIDMRNKLIKLGWLPSKVFDAATEAKTQIILSFADYGKENKIYYKIKESDSFLDEDDDILGPLKAEYFKRGVEEGKVKTRQTINDFYRVK